MRTKAARSQPGSARLKAADLKAAERRTQVRRRLLAAGTGVAVVVVFVAALVGVSLSHSGAAAVATPQAPKTDAQIAAKLASVSAGTFNSVGAGTATGLKALSGVPELTANGHPGS